jgi:hypothetical protein
MVSEYSLHYKHQNLKTLLIIFLIVFVLLVFGNVYGSDNVDSSISDSAYGSDSVDGSISDRIYASHFENLRELTRRRYRECARRVCRCC